MGELGDGQFAINRRREFSASIDPRMERATVPQLECDRTELDPGGYELQREPASDDCRYDAGPRPGRGFRQDAHVLQRGHEALGDAAHSFSDNGPGNIGSDLDEIPR